MKLITAIIQPDRLDEVRVSLSAAGVTGLTASVVKGHGAGASRTEYYRGEAHSVELRDKVRIEIIAAAELEDAIVDAIVTGARTGQIGDGKVWVTDVARVVRVRTGEEGSEAL
ncbi:nitrogen regulatory protein P-II 1 [Microbacterium sorbitolivorans]|uniref:P-II family nitrogen regulator n=1 Tax=Microbacterium sorbitolivorans TaxID=1867410 RepID=A0A367XYA4_9MICO|nr:P-II family nitrogen regulator [Microbacterium sorbitolivorans]RCK58625.1 P-II family nitrogen regulator [Microbacterium sorbitolivorans]GGF38009.1 nitrogen regulatory protein P-II 1 [Microbacterium sorbitolivorans]